MCEKAEQMGAGGEGSIFQTGSIVSAKDGTVIQCLTVIGQVEGHYLWGTGKR